MLAICWYYCFLLLTLAHSCRTVPSEKRQRAFELGLEHDQKIQHDRRIFEHTLAEYSQNVTYVQYIRTPQNETELEIRIEKNALRLYDDIESRQIDCRIVYNSTVPLMMSYDVDSPHAIKLGNASWYWFPVGYNDFLIPVHIFTRQIGLSYLRFWVGEASLLNATTLKSWHSALTQFTTPPYFSTFASPPEEFNSTAILGFPVVVLRGKRVVQLVFRIMIVTMVTLFTFTMGCELDPELLKAYSRRPVGPAIGFCCQFIIMPLLAFAIAKLVPIRTEFGFGLLTIGCSPGGGASNAWALMLGGDLNLSILMTFVSFLSSLFMMPLLLFAFGRFFIDVSQVKIPYGNICIQLLQIAIPALLGLGLRFWKPKAAKWFTKLTRPLFLFFILFFLTFGIYANLSILKLIGSYPIVMPTGALLPWLGFALAALIAFGLRQPRAVVITIALETGIQNVSAAILVLLYSMPQPAGDLGAVMPITVSLFTPIPLYFIYMGITIRTRCCQKSALTGLPEVRTLKEDGKPNEVVSGSKEVYDDLLERNDARQA
ncbi:Apical sodium-dependent bile acid transporter [Paragonimus heterotremus]|uniref:Apical sodium-dependent bile acid transporter n=1 Tax=Paragonimus heterotremus TaxID=100268 RepID=A0A8J4TL38_9TREM|nr:Apical sodium-dependent bile acid transporter [Paragonimus heterotremus]